MNAAKTMSICILWSVSLLAQASSAEELYLDPQFGFTRTSDVLFASKPAGDPAVDMDLYLELFQPAGPGAPSPAPAVILAHGGGFVSGDRNNVTLIQMCEELADRGYVCVSIDYRLAGDDPVIGPAFSVIANLASNVSGGATPDAVAASVEDNVAAYQYLLANHGALGVDPKRIAIGGSSAGATAAFLTGYLLPDIGILAPGAVDAVLSMWGGFGPNFGVFVGSDNPRLILIHGEDDEVSPVENVNALAESAVEASLLNEVYILAGLKHGFNIFTREVAPGRTAFDAIVDFFYVHVASAGAPQVPVLGGWARLLLGTLIALSALVGAPPLRKLLRGS
ncbi:MAG: alpha/beta hydrolase [Myxococcota bacterium]|nr:alpha/beta hydrolase [Myxococcota bacterium]